MGIMSSYNDWDGEPVTGSYYFLTELLRKQYGFDGYVVSDSEAVEFISNKHHVADDYKGAVKQAIEAGLNVRTHFTMPEVFILPLRELVKEGSVSMKTLDERVADVLKVKFRLGLFDSPYVKDPNAADQKVHTKADEELALQLNRESMVLLKNEKNLLPLNVNQYKNILVTGPLATETKYTTSRYGPSNNPIVSILDGIKAFAGKSSTVSYSKGCEVTDAKWPESEIMPVTITTQEQTQINEAVAAANKADVIIAVVGETDDLVGESKTRTGLNLPGLQSQLLQALYATGKPVVMVMVNGRPLTINWENKYLPAILQAGFLGPSAGKVVAETLFGENNPGGKLTMTYPKSIGQIEYNFPFKPASQAGQSKNEDPNGFGKTMVLGSLYPFGFGLSYTTFEFSNLKLSAQEIRSQGEIEVTVDLKNTGTRKGDEVVQLYLKDVVSSVTTYETVLRGFERVSLAPGETKTVKFTLTPDDLMLLDKNMKWTVEPGKFEVLIGNSSESIKLKKEFMVTK